MSGPLSTHARGCIGTTNGDSSWTLGGQIHPSQMSLYESMVVGMQACVFMVAFLGWRSAAGAEPAPQDQTAAGESSAADIDLSQGVGAYVAYGLQESPTVRAAFDRWAAAVQQIARARALPEPSLGFSVFLQAIETRTGPQQGRVSLGQVFPWPTALTAGADAAAARARAAEEEFAAVEIAAASQIASAYWNLWSIRAAASSHTEHLSVIDGLSEVLRAHVEVGTASFADLQQVDLSRARLASAIETMHAEEHVAAAALRGLLGLQDAIPVPTTDTPPAVALPEHSEEQLLAAARAHPHRAQAAAQADAAAEAVRIARARRMPGLKVGADWTLIGDAPSLGDGEMGRDALAVGLGISLPIWQRTYTADVAAARALQSAADAEQDAVAVYLSEAVQRSRMMVSDTARRVRVTRDTLLPQAEAAYASLLGGYTTGESSVAQVLLAQRDLLELTVELDHARAAHAQAWAALEHACGQPLPRRAPDQEAP